MTRLSNPRINGPSDYRHTTVLLCGIAESDSAYCDRNVTVAWSDVCPSVRLSVTLAYPTKAATG